MSGQPMFIQKDSTHYNIQNIVKIKTGHDCTDAIIYFVDGTFEQLFFDDQDDYNGFMHYIRSINCD